jgi:GNAT superfamily N-acetyltransferase
MTSSRAAMAETGAVGTKTAPSAEKDANNLGQAVLARALIESDCRYFETGARIEPMPGAQMVLLSGFETIPAGAVVLRVESGQIGDPDRWVDDFARRFAAVAARPRLYLTQPVPDLERVLARRGYRRTEEAGLVSTPDMPSVSATVALRPMRTETDWRERFALYQVVPPPPHGDVGMAMRWVAFDRRKSDLGYMVPYLIEDDRNTVCGAVSAADCGPILRLKNLVIHPHWQRRGIARATTVRMAEQAAASGRVLGVIAVTGHAAEGIYRGLGMQEVMRLIEWIGDDQRASRPE